MRSSDDQAAQTIGVLPAEVWYMDVWAEQTLSDDGERAQSRTGGCWTCLREVND